MIELPDPQKLHVKQANNFFSKLETGGTRQKGQFAKGEIHQLHGSCDQW
jgi:hypothetical protein